MRLVKIFLPLLAWVAKNVPTFHLPSKEILFHRFLFSLLSSPHQYIFTATTEPPTSRRLLGTYPCPLTTTRASFSPYNDDHLDRLPYRGE